QGDGGARVARGARPRACARCRRRYDRPRRVRCGRRAAVRGSSRGCVARIARTITRIGGDSRRVDGRVPRATAQALMHVDDAALARVRIDYGEPVVLPWEGEISEREWALATYNPARTHDVTLFIVNGDRLALLRMPHFAAGVW